MAAERHARAMGTDVNIIVTHDDTLDSLDRQESTADHLADVALARVRELERRWSRFDPDSEISRLNDSAGRPTVVSDDTCHLIGSAISVWQRSGGFVDCTKLHAVIDAGYDRSFDQLPADRPSGTPVPPRLRRLSPNDIHADGNTVTMPDTIGFDPGGIGKGLAADLIVDAAMRSGARGICVDLGGDVRVAGSAPNGGGWTIAIDHPGGRLALLGLYDGAVATSTTLRRQWRIDGRPHHHLIDPRTERPSTSDISFVTVIAGDALRAETTAKAILLRGGPHPFDLLDGKGMEALVTYRDGRVCRSAGFTRFTGGHEPPSSITERVALDSVGRDSGPKTAVA